MNPRGMKRRRRRGGADVDVDEESGDEAQDLSIEGDAAEEAAADASSATIPLATAEESEEKEFMAAEEPETGEDVDNADATDCENGGGADASADIDDIVVDDVNNDANDDVEGDINDDDAASVEVDETDTRPTSTM